MTDPDAPKPSLWQRVKAAVAPSMADSVIDRYVTPEHLPVLLGYRRIYRGSVRPALGLKEPPSALEGTWLGGTAFDRFASFWTRVRRAVFVSPTRFVLEVEDKYRPGRQLRRHARAQGLRVEAHRPQRHRRRRACDRRLPAARRESALRSRWCGAAAC